MLTPIVLNELQAERDALLSDRAILESQLEWASARIDAIDTLIALYAPDLLARRRSVPSVPLYVEHVAMPMRKRVLDGIHKAGFRTFTAKTLMAWMDVRMLERRSRSPIAPRIFKELLRLESEGYLIRDGDAFKRTPAEETSN